ncbi:MAG: hypothetical protein WDM79_17070 [Terricaulis sp.]
MENRSTENEIVVEEPDAAAELDGFARGRFELFLTRCVGVPTLALAVPVAGCAERANEM